MTTLAQASEALEMVFVQNWDCTPAKFDNKESIFKEPTDKPWVHFQVLFGASQNISICGDKVTARKSGVIQLYIYVPANKGVRESQKIADEFISIFENKTFDRIRTLANFASYPVPGANWHESRVSIPFQFNTSS